MDSHKCLCVLCLQNHVKQIEEIIKSFKTSKNFLYLDQIVISSIMCSYNKEDWTKLAKMAEVRESTFNWFLSHTKCDKYSDGGINRRTL